MIKFWRARISEFFNLWQDGMFHFMLDNPQLARRRARTGEIQIKKIDVYAEEYARYFWSTVDPKCYGIFEDTKGNVYYNLGGNEK